MINQIDISEMDDHVYDITEDIQLIFENDVAYIMTEEDYFTISDINNFKNIEQDTYTYIHEDNKITLKKEDFEKIVSAFEHYHQNK